jgi:hypothetical protein
VREIDLFVRVKAANHKADSFCKIPLDEANGSEINLEQSHKVKEKESPQKGEQKERPRRRG